MPGDGFRGVYHRARIRATHWLNPSYKLLLGTARCAIFEAKRFIAHSQNKISGTADIAEHRTSRFVVGAGKQTREEIFHD